MAKFVNMEEIKRQEEDLETWVERLEFTCLWIK